MGAPPLATGVSDLRALAHPLRLRMMELFAEAPRTTKQVAEMLGEPPTRLYHHVAALERSGLLVLKETRPNRGAVEKWYEAISRKLGTPARQKGKGKSARQARRAVALTVMEQARQEMMQVPAGGEAALLARLIFNLPKGKLVAVRERLMESVKEIERELGCELKAEKTDSSGNERWALTMAFAPVWPPLKKKKS